MATDGDELRRSPTLFGRRLADIPCYRSTFLYSTCASLGSIMACFLFTSKMRKAINVGMAVFPTVTITYWCYCRYNYSVTKFEYARLQEAMKRYHLKDMDERDK